MGMWFIPDYLSNNERKQEFSSNLFEHLNVKSVHITYVENV